MSARTGRRARQAQETTGPTRSEEYRQLRHPFTPQKIFRDDVVADMHAMSLKTLSDLGIKILLPEARDLLKQAGALVDEDSQMVRIGPEIVAKALHTAPRVIRIRASNPARDQMFQEGAMLFAPGAGCPNVTDALRGRRAGSLETFRETTMLQQTYDVIHVLGPSAKPQDVPNNIRHYDFMRTQIGLSDKPMFMYARGRGQVAQNLEMIQIANALSDAEMRNGSWAFTIINTNSPRMIDVPMALGIIDMARAGQMSIITPFCLAGAMAPITIAGALVLQHAEALAAIALSQIAGPGAPVAYGGFASNVDMKSGSPAFGTPAHVQLSIGSGQLARFIGLPWRSAAGSAGNVADMQSAGEQHMGLWAQLQANATITVHAAGWLEGGLTFGYEKFINDIEALQQIAELCRPVPQELDDLAWRALADVAPGGHFFATQHTMDRFRDAFYEPLVADLTNFGTWTEHGANTSTERATGIWQRDLANFKTPAGCAERADRIAQYIADGIAAGGAAPSEG